MMPTRWKPRRSKGTEKMTSRDFCYWLQGYFEIAGQEEDRSISGKRAEIIQRHLALVFKHEIDPSAGPLEHQEELEKIHEGIQPQPLTKVPHPGHLYPDLHDLKIRC